MPDAMDIALAPSGAGYEMLSIGEERSLIERFRSDRRHDIQEAAREFESYMIKLMLSELRKGTPSGGLFEDRRAAGYQALLDDALAQRIAEAGRFGLAQQLVGQWEGR